MECPLGVWLCIHWGELLNAQFFSLYIELLKLKFLYSTLHFCKERRTFSWCLYLASTPGILIYAVNVCHEWLAFSNIIFSLYPLACWEKIILCSILFSCQLLLPRLLVSPKDKESVQVRVDQLLVIKICFSPHHLENRPVLREIGQLPWRNWIQRANCFFFVGHLWECVSGG